MGSIFSEVPLKSMLTLITKSPAFSGLIVAEISCDFEGDIVPDSGAKVIISESHRRAKLPSKTPMFVNEKVNLNIIPVPILPKFICFESETIRARGGEAIIGTITFEVGHATVNSDFCVSAPFAVYRIVAQTSKPGGSKLLSG